ncbi:MAG: phosphoribosylformylglycinamidine synthase subunit PurQ [Chloroflexi bacterium]|nr:phosphoribosylformylglycinamidine synthase subunit PurQ [Chloroflexota bacterium]
MRFGVVVFPGTWSDTDCYHALGAVLGYRVDYVWHQQTDLSAYNGIVLPGGFSYGDYLRPGAIARFSPVMASVARFAADGGLVIGICNGFQVLCEAGLLPGVLLPNSHLQYRCQWTNLRVDNTMTPYTGTCRPGQVLRVPISHGDGNYYADEATLTDLERHGQVVFRYCTPDGEATPESNPNGAARNIAGICNQQRNVLGMMPHPERCCEQVLGGTDGRFIFQSIASYLEALGG